MDLNKQKKGARETINNSKEQQVKQTNPVCLKTEKEILEHISYLYRSYDHTDLKQLREFGIRLAELHWVLGYANTNNPNIKSREEVK